LGITLLFCSWIVLGTGSLLLVFLRNRNVSHTAGTVIVSVSSILMIAASLWVLISGSSQEYYQPWNVPFGSFYLRIDPLSALFLLLLGVVGGLSALYSHAYFSEEKTHRSLAGYWFFYFILFGGMSLVFTAYNGVLFLMAWEGMSLASFFLVLHENHREEVRKAGWIYFVATHGGTAFLLVLFGFGVLTGVLGVLYGLGKRDMKEILAYSSIEHIGIIGMGLGVGLYGMSRSLGVAALLGFTACLFHVINHGFLKSSLFLGAGSVLHATHTGNIEELGGLFKKLPKTGALFGLSSFGIAGLPPLNGFVGEFLLLLSVVALCIQGRAFLDIFLALVVLLSLGIIGGGSVACFTRLFGVTFLGEPRKDKEIHPIERGTWIFPLYILAGSNFLMGIGSLGLAPLVFGAVVSTLPDISYQTAIDTVRILRQTLLPLGMLGVLFLSVLFLLYRIRNSILKRRSVDSSPTWDCGYILPSPRMQYTGSSFSQPILRLFRGLLQIKEAFHWEGRLFPTSASYASKLYDVAMRTVYEPILRSITKVATRIYGLQEGRNQVYILYIALTLLILMVMFLGGIP